MSLVRVAVVLAALSLLGACAHQPGPGPMPCSCLPPPAGDPAKG